VYTIEEAERAAGLGREGKRTSRSVSGAHDELAAETPVTMEVEINTRQ